MIEAGKRYMMITVNHAKETVSNFVALVTYVEDRGEYLYVGFIPEDKREGKLGAVKVYKDYSNRNLALERILVRLTKEAQA